MLKSHPFLTAAAAAALTAGIGLASASGAWGETTTPQNLVLKCAPAAGGVSCSWNQSASPAFAHYVLLRSRPTGPGRVIAMIGSVTTTSATDSSACAPSTYLVDSLDSSNHVIEHSNFVTVSCPA